MGQYEYFKQISSEDNSLAHMKSTTNEKGSDNKNNNSSEYNHYYYMTHKKKKTGEEHSNVKYETYKEGDSDFDESNFSKENNLGDTDFYGFKNSDGSWVILEEDMKWTVPGSVPKEKLVSALEKFEKEISAKRESGEKYTADDWTKAATSALNKASKIEKPSEKKNDYLAHHGILGQRWGYRRYQNPDGSLTKLGESRLKKVDRIDLRNDYLEKKYYKKLARASRYEKRAEKIHAERDLGASNRKAVKSARYQIKADKLKRKAVTVDDDYNKAKLLVKAEENQYKSDKYHRDADLLSKLTGYSFAAMRNSQKAANLEANAQKIRVKIQRNKRYQELIKKRISEIPNAAERQAQKDADYNKLLKAFDKSKEGKEFAKSSAANGGLDKNEMRRQMDKLAERDSSFKKAMEDYDKKYF